MSELATQEPGTGQVGAPASGGTGAGAGVGQAGTDPSGQTAGTQTSPDGGQTAQTPTAPDLDALRAGLKGLPADQIAEIVKDTPYAVEVSRTVRKSWVQQEAEKLARELVGREAGALTTRLSEAETRLSEITRAQEEAKLAAMSDNERDAYLARKEAAEAKAKAENLERFKQSVEEEQAKLLWLEDAKTKYGLASEDVAKLSAIDDPETMVLQLLDLKDKREKEAKKMAEDMSTRLEAIERRLNGATTFASTAPASPGGEMSFDDLRRAYVERPEDDGVRQRYEEAYRKRRT